VSAGQPHPRASARNEGKCQCCGGAQCNIWLILRLVWVFLFQETLCFSCTSKNRRSRSGRGLAAPDAHLGVTLPETKPTAPAPAPVLAPVLVPLVADSFSALTGIVPVAVVSVVGVAEHIGEPDAASVALSTTTSESAGTEVSFPFENVATNFTTAMAGGDVGQSELVKRKCGFSHESSSTHTSENNTHNV